MFRGGDAGGESIDGLMQTMGSGSATDDTGMRGGKARAEAPRLKDGPGTKGGGGISMGGAVELGGEVARGRVGPPLWCAAKVMG